MPTVLVLARDWNLRANLRAELRERGVEALGMESADDVGRMIAAGQAPSVAVIEALPELAGDPAIQRLIKRVPTILITSRTETVPLPPVDTVLCRPIRIADIVARVEDLLRRGHLA